MKILQSIQPWQDKAMIYKKLEMLWLNEILDLRINLKPCSEKTHFDELLEFINNVINIKNDVRFYIDIGYPFDSIRTKIPAPYYISLKVGQRIFLKKYDEHDYKLDNLNILYLRENTFFLKTHIGDKIIYGDGNIIFKVVSILEDALLLESQNNGIIFDGKSLHFSSQYLNKCYNIDFLLDYISNIPKDNLHGIICSFVDDKNQILELKKKTSINIISKLETSKAIKNIDEISSVSDMIMLGRGDLLFNTCSLKDYIICQYNFIDYVQKNNKKAIIATNIFESFANTNIPKQSEITDVWTLIKCNPNYLCLSSNLLYGEFYNDCISCIKRLIDYSI